MLTIAVITHEKAIDLCQAEKIAARRSHELRGVQSLRCKFCGDTHEFTKGTCSALRKCCHRCHRKNHFEKVCKANSKGRRSKRVKEVKDESFSESDSASDGHKSSDESSEEYEIGKNYDNSLNGGCVLVELDLKFNDS